MSRRQSRLARENDACSTLVERVMVIHCPKCGYSRTSTDTAPKGECPACGVVFDKLFTGHDKGSDSVFLSKTGAGRRAGSAADEVQPHRQANSAARLLKQFSELSRQTKLLIGLGALFVLFAVSMTQENSSRQPSEAGSNVSSEVRYAVQAAVKHAGYRCDTLSAVVPHVFVSGYRVTCNDFRYAYSIKDQGGRWAVSLD